VDDSEGIVDNIIIVNESPQEVLVQITSLRGDAGTNGIDAKISIIGNNGTDITAEPKLNFTGGLGAIDDSINLKTDAKLDITNLILETSLSDDDIIAFYDTSTIMHKKSILSTIKTYILGTLFNISTGHNHDGQNSKIISGSYLAPTTASYLVLGLDSSLSNEKKLIAGSGISLITNTSSSTLSIDNNIIAGSGIVLINNINASSITISSTISASSIAPSTASYIVLSLNSSLSNEWLLSAGSGITLTQNSSASTLTIDTIAPINASYVVLDLTSGLNNEWKLISGNNISLMQDSSSSTITVSSYYSASSITSYGEDGNLLMISGSGEYATIADSDVSVYDFVSASAIPAYGDNGNFLMISGSGDNAIMSDSGISTFDVVSASSVAPATGSYVVLALNSEMPDEWLLTAGSNITLTQNISSSTVTIGVNSIFPSFANNAAAIAGSLVIGSLYKTGGDPDLICVVH
jgi:hypothetical protein